MFNFYIESEKVCKNVWFLLNSVRTEKEFFVTVLHLKIGLKMFSENDLRKEIDKSRNSSECLNQILLLALN